MTTSLPVALVAAWRERALVPYLGPRILGIAPDAAVPATPEALVARLTARTSVPHKIRGRLTQAAQFIENFKHRRTLVGLMNDAFAAAVAPTALHRAVARLAPPIVVDAWYDATMRAALGAALPADAWGEVQGLSQSEHFGTWTRAYDAAGAPLEESAETWTTILYKPLGAAAPAANYLVSDSDFVEVLTEIDIQTPIPAAVQARRRGLPFLYLGCRFDDQLARSFARQVSKRSTDRHWAVLPDVPTRMEARFLAEQGIERLPLSLDAFQLALSAAVPGTL